MNKPLMLSLTLAGGIALGAAGTHLYQEHQSKDVTKVTPSTRSLSSFYDRVFDDDFFMQSSSPFKQMQKMREEMDRAFEDNLSFDSWYGDKFGGALNEIAQEENDDFVMYRLGLEGVDKESVKIDVAGNQVNVSGERSEVQAQEEEGGQRRKEFHQAFRRSFPVPQGVDADKVTFETQGDEIVIKFPKTKQATL